MQKILLTIIWLYQKFIRPFLPTSCRFYPSCSCYTHEAIQAYGTLTGIYLGAKRICHCHPFCSGGYDPVPGQEKKE